LLAVERPGGIEPVRGDGDAVVVAAPAPDVGVEGDIALAAVDQDRAVLAGIDARQPPAEFCVEAVAWDDLRNAVVGGVDDTPDRLRAPPQGRRAADHLDLSSGERIDRRD